MNCNAVCAALRYAFVTSVASRVSCLTPCRSRSSAIVHVREPLQQFPAPCGEPQRRIVRILRDTTCLRMRLTVSGSAATVSGSKCPAWTGAIENFVDCTLFQGARNPQLHAPSHICRNTEFLNSLHDLNQSPPRRRAACHSPLQDVAPRCVRKPTRHLAGFDFAARLLAQPRRQARPP